VIVRSHVDLHRPAQVDARLGDVAGRQPLAQLLHDDHRPSTVEALPRRELARGRAEMIAQRHGGYIPCKRNEIMNRHRQNGLPMESSSRVHRAGQAANAGQAQTVALVRAA
jgi:hypothetical protein